jgi:hypothetical protein
MVLRIFRRVPNEVQILYMLRRCPINEFFQERRTPVVSHERVLEDLM